MKSEDGKSQEILIIRRGGGDDNAAPKGGAWKIAYADFVTAMMAFFLVMWLINSANEVTKARVASYFNPIKMTDAAPTRRGLKETTDAQNPNVQVEQEEEAVKRGDPKVTGNAKEPAGLTISDEALLMNPYLLLDELVKRSSPDPLSGSDQLQSVEIGDPFNPQAFENLKDVPKGEAGARTEAKKTEAPDTSDAAIKERKQDARPEVADPAKASAADAPHPAEPAQLPPQKAPQPTAEDLKLAEDLRDRIEAKLEGAKGKIDIGVQVEVTPEGLLIILEDGKGRSMFAVGSAQPNPALIEIVGEIGQLLAGTEGGVVIRGHTDGRLFRNRKYDNWQLSTDRAHMASYMLIRGGLPESRVSRIEGYGSSKPVEKNNFMLDANRRVEFLLTK